MVSNGDIGAAVGDSGVRVRRSGPAVAAAAAAGKSAVPPRARREGLGGVAQRVAVNQRLRVEPVVAVAGGVNEA